MSGNSHKRKSEVIWSDHAYSVAAEGVLGPFCQPEIALETENKYPCLGLLVPAATTKPAESHVDPAQRTMPVEGAVEVEVDIAALKDMEIVEESRPAPSGKGKRRDNAAADQISRRHVLAPATSNRKQRCRLLFPAGHGKTASELFSGFAALLRQHPDLQPLYEEGRNQPYITVSTDSSFYATLLSESFLGLVMECPGYGAPISQHSAWIRSRRTPKSLLAAAIVGVTTTPTPSFALSGLGPKGSLPWMR
ncbi:hypothetical protein E2C01_070361 [Portunus trituberculatus]|uniref:Uncharacterized protein n=1 Tax=Portunus trituberculatus TaxID=210409 RepID=A0A5B7HTY9_PORTR|nr:hypothetical protein [Portunus trituberculatus]